LVAIVVKGIKSVGALAAKMRAIPGIAHYATSELAGETVDLVLDGFAKESDPYGKKWAPKKRSNGKPVGVDTGAMKGSVSQWLAARILAYLLGCIMRPISTPQVAGPSDGWCLTGAAASLAAGWIATTTS